MGESDFLDIIDVLTFNGCLGVGTLLLTGSQHYSQILWVCFIRNCGPDKFITAIFTFK